MGHIVGANERYRSGAMDIRLKDVRSRQAVNRYNNPPLLVNVF
jgi:hypothetical protein